MRHKKSRVLKDKSLAGHCMLKPISWLAQVASVQQLITEHSLLLSFLGEQGSGKTTFASLLHTELLPHVHACVMLATPLFDKNIFLSDLSGLLFSKSAMSLSEIAATCNRERHATLLVIDEAQYISVDFIEDMLKVLQKQGKGAYFHVCLLSDYALVPALNKLVKDAYPDMIHSMELGALSESETKIYVTKQLTPQKGIEKIITDERIKQFYQLTAGHFVSINRQMAGFFSYKPVRSWRQPKWIRQGGLAVGVCIVASGFAYFGLVQEEPSTAFVTLADEELPSVIPEATVALASEIPAFTERATRQALFEIPLHKAEHYVMNENVDTEQLVIMDKVIVAPKVVPHPVTKLSKPAVAVALKPLPTTDHYTIQLLASRNQAELKHFTESHHFHGKVTLHRTTRLGVVWYVLTVGEYTKHEQAIVAAAHLTKDMAQFKPWVRKLSQLKAIG